MSNKTALHRPRGKASPASGFAGSAFHLDTEIPVNKLIDLGYQRGFDSVSHTLFLHRPVLHIGAELTTGEFVVVSGVCSYRYVRVGPTGPIHGVLWTTLRAKTVITPYRLAVSQYGDVKSFNPVFDLEKLGLLFYVGSDSSVVVIPASIDFRLLVKATSGSSTIT